jgi:ubiquitin-conjugating enzyme E2 D/E
MMMNNNMMMNNMMNMGANATLNRIKKEFQLCQQDSELIQIGCSFGLVNPNNIFQWKVTMVGPKGTPYENGLFTIIITFPMDYPKKGAEFKFKNKIYHLNVDWRDNGDKGHICLSTLNEWKSTGKVIAKRGFGVKQALFDIFCLFYNQGIESPYDDNIARQYRDNRAQFDAEAKRWTKEYAK